MSNNIDLKIQFKTDAAELDKLKKKIQEIGTIELTPEQSKSLKSRDKKARVNMKNAANRGDELKYNTYYNEVLQIQKELLACVTISNKQLVQSYVQTISQLNAQQKALIQASADLNKQKKLLSTDNKDLFISNMNWIYGGKNASKENPKTIAGIAGLRATLKNSSSVDEVINIANNLTHKDSILNGKALFQGKNLQDIKNSLSGSEEQQIQQIVDILLEKMVQHAKKSFVKNKIKPAEEKFKTETKAYNQTSNKIKNIEKQFNNKAFSSTNTEINSKTKTNNQKIVAAFQSTNDQEVNKIIDEVNKNAKQEKDFEKSEKTADSFSKKLLKTFSFGIILRQLKRLGQVAVQTVQQIDEALTTQAMVSGRTRKETYALLGSYQALAKQCGATSTEVAQVATAYLRQGRTATDALKLTETAVKAAKVAGIDTATSVDYLTTAINGFQMSADQAMQVSDRFAALAANAAVSYDELAIALSKVAAQANLAGLSMDYTMALLTKGIETTRESAESIGTALKTVLARMREVSDYGETLDGSLSLNNVEQQLSYVGIQLKDANGELKSTEVVLNELGNKWDSLNSNQQAAIAKALAGTRQQSRLIAMMQDYERVNELLLISQRSLGATEAQMATYMSGMEASINQVKSAYEGLISSFTNSDIIINAISGLAKLIEIVAQNSWILWTVLGAVTIAMLAQTAANWAASVSTKKHAKAIKALNDLENKNSKITLLSIGIKLGLIPPQVGLAVAKKATAEATKKETAAVWANNMAWYANPIVAIIAAIVILIAVIAIVVIAICNMTSAIEKNNKRMQELTVAIYNLEKSAQKIDTLIAKFDLLDNKILKSSEDLKELDNLLSQMADTLSEDQQKVFNALDRQSKILYMKQYSSAQKSLSSSLQDQRLQVAIEGKQLNNGKLTDAGVAAVKDSYLRDLTTSLEKGSYSSEEQLLLTTFADNLSSNLEADSLISKANIQGSSSFSKKEIKDLKNTLGISKKEAKQLLEGDTSVLTTDAQFAALDKWLKSKGYDGSTFDTNWMSSLSKNQLENIKILQENSTDYASAIKALDSLLESTSEMEEVSGALEMQYRQLLELKKLFGDSIENQVFSFSIEQLQQLQDALKDFGDESIAIIKNIMSSNDAQSLATNVQKAVDEAILKGIVDGNDEEAIDAYRNRLLNIVSGNVLDSAQKFTSAKNSVSNIYKTLQQKQKGELSTLDEASFLSENEELFKDENFYKAWQSGDWNAINTALGNTEFFKNLQDQTLENLNKGLASAIASGNQSMQDFYRKAIYEAENSLLSTSLENIREIQNAQIDAYKKTLEKENDLLVSNLTKKKEAYQKYFDSIKEQSKDEDYLEQREILVSNISKLGVTSSAGSQKQAAELEAQLQQLEKDRIKEMRERAQEALIQSIDDEITTANNNLKELTNSTEKILQAILAQEDKDSLAGQIALADLQSGINAADFATNIKSTANTFGVSEEDILASMFTKIGTDNVKLEKDQKGNMILNVGGQEVNLTPIQGDTLYKTIMDVLNKLKIST